MIPTETLRALRDDRVRARPGMKYSPPSVEAKNEEHIAILTELIAWREALETLRQHFPADFRQRRQPNNATGEGEKAKP